MVIVKVVGDLEKEEQMVREYSFGVGPIHAYDVLR